MNKAEVIDLFIEIKQEYPQFNDSVEEVDRHLKYLKDFPFDAALNNVEQHIKTSKWPPGISEIRGSLGEQIERDRMKMMTSEHFANLDSWGLGSVPPDGYWESVMQKLRGDAGA